MDIVICFMLVKVFIIGGVVFIMVLWVICFLFIFFSLFYVLIMLMVFFRVVIVGFFLIVIVWMLGRFFLKFIKVYFYIFGIGLIVMSIGFWGMFYVGSLIIFGLVIVFINI